MKKLFVIACLLMGVCVQSDAQVLKKLEDAINKMVNATENVKKMVNGDKQSSTNNTTTTTKSANTKTQSAGSQAPQTIRISSTPAAANNPLVVDNLGIAGIVLGGKMSSVPKSVPGLYAKYTETIMGEEGTSYECWNAQGELLMNVDDQNEDGIIDRIYIMVKGVKIANTNIEIGAPFAKIVNTPGLVKTKDEYGNELYLYKKRYEVQEEVDSHKVYAICIY